MARDFEGKVVVVTGGGYGIGRAACLAFARDGAKVVVADVDVKSSEETVSLIKKAGGEAIVIKTDVSQATDVEALVRKTVETYGSLDCAFNNVGIHKTFIGTIDFAEKDWNRMIDVNLKGMWLCMKYEIPQMLKQGKGCYRQCILGSWTDWRPEQPCVYGEQARGHRIDENGCHRVCEKGYQG